MIIKKTIFPVLTEGLFSKYKSKQKTDFIEKYITKA